MELAGSTTIRKTSSILPSPWYKPSLQGYHHWDVNTYWNANEQMPKGWATLVWLLGISILFCNQMWDVCVCLTFPKQWRHFSFQFSVWISIWNMLCLANTLKFKHCCSVYKTPAGIARLSCLIGGLSHRSSTKHVLVSFDASYGYSTVPCASELRRLGHPSQVSVVFPLPQLLDGGLYASVIY